jgi:single-stranded-DNA-specific exonuclease
VGCALPTERVSELRARLDAYARQRLTPEDFIPELEYDAEVGLDEINHNFWLALQRLEPYGVGNQTPTFVARGARLLQPARILKEKHLKLRALPVDPNANGGCFQRAHDIVGWRMAERAAESPLLAGDVLDLAFTVDYNEHPDFGGVQLSLEDFQHGTPMISAAAPNAAS